MNDRYDIIPTALAVKAMRDNGYKNAAFALAELIDNSIQARSSEVELLIAENYTHLSDRTRRHIQNIAVLDNGIGMDADVLRIALQFGNGTYLNSREGIGRFGMGLPSSSISQCRRVDVWSWQNGPDNALHSYIDIEEIMSGDLREVPEPVPAPIPEVWREIGRSFEKSGTLVVWSNIDRCVWRTASAVFRNSEFVIGRMYRYFLKDGRVKIRLASFIREPRIRLTEDTNAVLNDPLYLMVPCSCPSPYDKAPMFVGYGESFERTITIQANGQPHDVFIRFTYAKEDARKGINPGALPHGKHAAKNIGVSVVRARRELELSQDWAIQYDPTERWWGVEIEFPPALDEIFGVSNNKQAARNLSEIAKYDFEQLRGSGISIIELKSEMKQDEDPLEPLLEIKNAIETNLRSIRRLIKAQTISTKRKRHESSTVEAHATEVTNRRKEEGHVGLSDQTEDMPADEKELAIEIELEESGLPKEEAERLAATTINDGLKYVFAQADLETPAFFSVKPRAGVIIITLNTSHPAYDHLIEVLEEEAEDITPQESLARRLKNARDGLKLLLAAWARFEDEQPSEALRDKAQDIRVDWGKIARQFLYR